MDSQELAKYLESTNSVAKPWLLVQLRLKKLEESRQQISEDAYAEQLADIHEDLMKLGEWWRDLEDQVF
jgi:predicted house-cleaning noncanonical NTP pyrophosphatase (MazG superfamily)